MPIHIHPLFRSLELAEESLGLIKPINSLGFTIHVAEENAGKRPPAVVPTGPGFNILGQKIPHSK